MIRSVVALMRKIVTNHRYAPRYDARVLLVVSSLDHSTRRPTAHWHSPTLEGYTRDISATGLALIVPAIHIGGRYLTGENRTLLITLNLPPQPIEIQATAMRYERLGEEDTKIGYLIGAHITMMNEEDRARYTTYLRTLR